MTDFASERYDRMKYRRCGRSGLMLPEISLGFWQSLGKGGNEDLCRRCAYYAFDHGVTHFDLANNYGPPPGNSELVLGNILRDMPRDELVVSTKAGYFMWPGPYGDGGGKKYLIASLDQSLRRLGLDYVDIYYHHRPDDQTPIEETMAALDLVVKQGKALYAGVSNYPGATLRQACDVIARHDWAPITIHQPRINMLQPQGIGDVLPAADELGVGAIAFSPLAQGRLTEKYLNGLPPDSRWGQAGERGIQWYENETKAGTWDKVSRLAAIARARGQTMAQLALAWLLDDRRITSALVGVSRVEQLQEALGAVQSPPLSAEEKAKISTILGV